jgi:hypothetical protein
MGCTIPLPPLQGHEACTRVNFTLCLLPAERRMFAASKGRGSRYPNDTLTSEFSCVFYIKGRRIIYSTVC